MLRFANHFPFAFLFAFLACSTLASVASAQRSAPKASAEPVPQALLNYVQHADGAFAWKLNATQALPQGKIYDIELTSQRWQGIVWKHVLQVFEPQELKSPRQMLLMVTGGSTGSKPDRGDMERGLALAKLCGARVAMIHQVPNQPLLGDHTEDDLITETWLKYIETGDETWPLLFPMVKSAMRAMDALQALASEQWAEPIDGFVITGGSKRGWTSWLTPVADKRIIATAPIVIDVLNFRAQMKHQMDTWGAYSEQIYDYYSKGLIVEGDESPREMQLRKMMDPYTYREQLTLPKLLVHGTNDPYWVVDAAKWYWDDLQGPKYLLKVPNAGHGLDGGAELALSTIAAFFRHVVNDAPMPELKWQHVVSDETITMHVSSSQPPQAARLWSAASVDKDFRDEKWTSQPMSAGSDGFSSTTKRPAGYVAQYAELSFEFEGVPFSLCTLIFRD